MSQKNLPVMDETQVQPTWKLLCQQEQRLRRNRRLSRLLQPIGLVLFMLLLFPTTVNLLLANGGERIAKYFEELPFLPALVSVLPHGSVTSASLTLVLLSFLLPLAVSGVIFTLTLLKERRNPIVIPSLAGTPTACARALVVKAETVYELRRSFFSVPVYFCAGLPSGLMAIPIIAVLLKFAKEGGVSPLYYALGCFALLLCLFILFWFFVLLFWCFSLLNALFYRSESEWKLYEQYQRIDTYWESIDPAEHEKRERAVFEQRKQKK